MIMDGLLGEIKIWPGKDIPMNYIPCDGKIFYITENEQLYNLIGNRFGGEEGISFAIPNLEGTENLTYIICFNGITN